MPVAAKAFAAIILVAVTCGFLPFLAERQLTAYLRDEAAHALALQAAGKSPYQWRFREADDIVAGRVFGAREFSFDGSGLQIRSDGIPFEIGLPLARPVDLLHFPLLHIVATADTTASLRVVARRTLDAPESAGSPTALQNVLTALDLSADSALPPTAAMLRLRFEVPAGRVLRLNTVSLQLRAASTKAPMRELRPGSVERQLLELRRIRDDTPSAIVLPAGGIEAASAPLRSQDALDTSDAFEPNWLATAVFAAILLCARARPPRHARVRALVEVVLVLVVPVWLIVGDRYTGHVDRIQASLIAIASIYAFSLGWPRGWRWNGSVRAWGLAASVVLLAAGVGFVLHRPEAGMHPLRTSHAVRYLGWALIQQYLICAVCLERWRTVTGSAAAAVYLGALCFALLHTPNSSLMLATFAGGLFWCALYVREHALLPLAFSHAASAMLLIALLPPEILLSAEVSARFFQ